MTLPRWILALALLTSATTAHADDEGSGPGLPVEDVKPEAQPAMTSDRDDRRTKVRLTGGLGELRGGDVNGGVAFWSGAFESYLYNEVVGLQQGDGEPAALRRGTELGADAIVHLTRHLALVGGVARIEGSSTGSIEHAVVYGPFRETARNATALRVRAVPLRLGAQYATPIGRRASLAVEGGIGLYFTRLSWVHEVDVGGRTNSWASETRGRDLGLHGGVWVDVGLSDRLGLVFGVEAVRAEVGGLHGYREGTFSYRSPTRDDGALSLAGPEPPQFLVVGEGSWVNEQWGPIRPVREATIGLSGVRFRGGLRVGL